MELEIVGAIKIKDGLFIGDEFAAKVRLSLSMQLTLTLTAKGFRICYY